LRLAGRRTRFPEAVELDVRDAEWKICFGSS
jgi:hypothetical protein